MGTLGQEDDLVSEIPQLFQSRPRDWTIPIELDLMPAHTSIHPRGHRQ
jgi:hypothetical protein